MCECVSSSLSRNTWGGREVVADFFIGFYLFDSMQETEKMHSAVFFLRVKFHAGYKDIMMAGFKLRIREEHSDVDILPTIPRKTIVSYFQQI